MSARKRRSEMSIDQVQRWVVSLLVFAICSFPVGGLIGVSIPLIDQDRRSGAVVLIVMSGVIGMVCVGIVRIIHKRSVVTPLLVLGALPAVIAAFLIF